MKKIKLLKMKPTQMALGMLEVEDKIKQLGALKSKKFAKEVDANPIQVVQGPDSAYYIVDGHHRTLSYWYLGLTDAPVKVIYRFAKSVHYKSFWSRMLKNNWAHPFDQFGKGPHDPIYFAQDIRELGNDPYRSLAYLVRESGGYRKSTIDFADFQWAQFFRKHRSLKYDFKVDYYKALKPALALARSKKAKALPGYKAK